MTRTSILVFGTNRDEIHSWANSVKERCKEWGVSLRGPITLPKITVFRRTSDVSMHYSNADTQYGHWLEDIQLTDDEKDEIYPASDSNKPNIVCGRLLRLEDNRAVNKIITEEIDENLNLRVELTAGGGSGGHEPNGKHIKDAEIQKEGSKPNVIDQLMDDFGVN